jgi:predicted Zn-dependent peptidase
MEPGAHPHTPSPAHPAEVWQFTLANGFRIWGETRPHSATLAAHLVVGAGARHAARGQAGLPHFVEHLLFSGTERWPEARLHAVLQEKGGEFGGWTGYDTVGYWVQIPHRRLALALKWLAQLVFHPSFPEHKLGKERRAIASERSLLDPQLLRILRRLRLTEDLDLTIDARLFGRHLEDALGDDAHLGGFTRNEVADFHWQRYTPGNAGLVVVGNIVQEQVADLAERYFGDLAARPAPPDAPPKYPSGPHTITVHGPTERRQVTLALGARTVGSTHADRWPLEILEDILGQRLVAELRFRRGLTYTPWAYNVFHRDSGYFATQVTIADRHEEWARDTLQGEIEDIAQGKGTLSRRAVRRAAQRVWANWGAADENNFERTETLADLILDWPPDQPPPDIAAALSAVTPEDITRVVQTYFVPERQFVGRHSPIFALDNLEESLEARFRDAKRLALFGLGAAAVSLVWQRVMRPGRQ